MIRQDRRSTVGAAVARVKRMEGLPNGRVGEALDATLMASFWDAQESVPVDSGALRASGRSGSNLREGEDWLGRMAWGGVDHGDPRVEYALYVYALGGEHDWTRNSPAWEEAFEATIVEAIDAELDL